VTATAAATAAAFNRNGKWAARPVEHHLAVELRHVDTGEVATTVWLPAEDTVRPYSWAWVNDGQHFYERPSSIGLDELVKDVTESLPGGAS
jgi:hypothetical protein